jgi:hypothetical protein
MASRSKSPTSSPRHLRKSDAGEKENNEELNVSRFSKIEGGRARLRVDKERRSQLSDSE